MAGLMPACKEKFPPPPPSAYDWHPVLKAVKGDVRGLGVKAGVDPLLGAEQTPARDDTLTITNLRELAPFLYDPTAGQAHYATLVAHGQNAPSSFTRIALLKPGVAPKLDKERSYIGTPGFLSGGSGSIYFKVIELRDVRVGENCRAYFVDSSAQPTQPTPKYLTVVGQKKNLVLETASMFYAKTGNVDELHQLHSGQLGGEGRDGLAKALDRLIQIHQRLGLDVCQLSPLAPMTFDHEKPMEFEGSISAVAAVPATSEVIVAMFDGPIHVLKRDTNGFTQTQTLPGPDTGFDLLVTRDGKWLFAPSRVGAKTWYRSSLKQPFKPRPGSANPKVDEHDSPAAALSADDRYLVQGWHWGTKLEDRPLEIFPVHSKKGLLKPVPKYFTAKGHSCTSLAWFPDGRALACGSQPSIWNFDPRKGFTKQGDYPGHQGDVHDVAISKDGRWVVTVASQAEAVLWRVGEGRKLIKTAALAGHTDDVNAAAFSPDGKYLLTGGSDHTVIVWRLTPDGAQALDYLPATGDVYHIEFISDQALVIATSHNLQYWHRPTTAETI